MTISITLHPLTRADGSATYTHAPTNTTILCGVNFPVEAPARSSLPEECYVEVNVRPHNGVGQVKERHLEYLVADTLRSVVLLENYPRMMLQVTLQVVSRGRDEQATGGQGESYLPVLAGLVNAAVASCLDAGVGMRATAMATTVAVMKGTTEVRVDPGVQDIKGARSLHVLGFSSVGDTVLVESEGSFTFEEWELVEELAQRTCLAGVRKSGDMMMQDEEAGQSVLDVLRGAVETKVTAEERWRDG
jgi:exosome complex component RRP46